MKRHGRTTRIPPLRDERGVSLPLALVALVAVTVLVSSALVSASTELAISHAHGSSTGSLYAAEGGLAAYVAEHGGSFGDVAGGAPIEYAPDGGAPIRLSVVHLATLESDDSSLVRLFSVRAAPVGGGRTVAALVTQRRAPAAPLPTNITAAVTLGGDLRVEGGAVRVSGRAVDPGCGGEGQAVRMTAESGVERSAGGGLDGFLGVDGEGNDLTGEAAIERSALSPAELALDALGGLALEDLIQRVPPAFGWGPRFTPTGGPLRQFSGYLSEADGVAVIDGDGGVVRVEGGAGVLIIVNGELEMTGDAKFDGIILVEGSFRLNGRAAVDGAVVGVGGVPDGPTGSAATAVMGGSASVQYDRCAVDAAAGKFGEITYEAAPPVVVSTFGWQEVAG